jgi:hypothetical protein
LLLLLLLLLAYYHYHLYLYIIIIIIIIIILFIYFHRNQSVSLCNDSVIVTTIYEMYNDSLNRYNVSAQLIQRLFFLNRYNDSQIVITVQAENIFFSCFRRSILKGSHLSLIVCTRSI